MNEVATGIRRWTPAKPVDPKKQRQYENQKAAHEAQKRLEAQQAAERLERNAPSGIQMPTRANDQAKAGDQLGLFGEASRPKREAPPTLAPGGESRGKQSSLFDTKGSADQSMLFATDDVTPDEMIGGRGKGYQPMLLDQQSTNLASAQVKDISESGRIPGNHVIAKVKDFDGKTLGYHALPYDGTEEHAKKVARELRAHVSRMYPEWSNGATLTGMTDAEGNPSHAISPNGRHAYPTGTDEAAALMGDYDAFQRASKNAPSQKKKR